MNPLRGIALLGAALFLPGCSLPDGTLITDCVDSGDLHPVCGMQSPEDIAIVPGGDYLLLSELGSIGERPGRILAFNVNDESWRPLYPVAGTPLPAMLQGDTGCTDPPGAALSPHGSHLVQLDDGSWRYLVVNHGGREAVEIFALETAENNEPSLQWQGCLFPAGNTVMNDVVGLRNGDVIYTRMYHPDDLLGKLRALLGFESGDVWRWSRATGTRLLPGTGGSLTNGIEISADERFIFINQYMDKEIQKYDLAAQEVVGRAPVANADNSAWAPGGELWVASQSLEAASYLACTGDPAVTCGTAFDIVALDPETMESRVIFQHQGPPMGAATVAIPHRGKVYIGSFLGDRLLVVPMSEFTLSKN